MKRVKLDDFIPSLLMVFLFLGGCMQAPALKIYSLELPQVQKHRKGYDRSKVLKVTFPQSISEQISEKMNFSYSANEYGTYLNSTWSNHMGKLLQGMFVEVISRAALFRLVVSDTSTLREDYRLESSIFRFEHRVRGEDSDAVVSIAFALINNNTDLLVKSKRFTYTQPTPTVDAKGYAAATNHIIQQLSQDLLLWLQ